MEHPTTDMLESIRRYATRPTTPEVIGQLATKIEHAITQAREDRDWESWPELGEDGRWDAYEIKTILSDHLTVREDGRSIRFSAANDKPAILVRSQGNSIIVSGDW